VNTNNTNINNFINKKVNQRLTVGRNNSNITNLKESILKATQDSKLDITKLKMQHELSPVKSKVIAASIKGVVVKSNSKPKNPNILIVTNSSEKKCIEISSLSDLTCSTRKECHLSTVYDYNNINRGGFEGIPTVNPPRSCNKSRNLKLENCLRTTSMGRSTTKGGAGLPHPTKNCEAVYSTVSNNTIEKVKKCTLETIVVPPSKSVNKNKRENDMAILSSNYQLLKQKVDQLKSSLENRPTNFISKCNIYNIPAISKQKNKFVQIPNIIKFKK
jgi:hypothetical protein